MRCVNSGSRTDRMRSEFARRNSKREPKGAVASAFDCASAGIWYLPQQRIERSSDLDDFTGKCVESIIHLVKPGKSFESKHVVSLAQLIGLGRCLSNVLKNRFERVREFLRLGHPRCLGIRMPQRSNP